MQQWWWLYWWKDGGLAVLLKQTSGPTGLLVSQVRPADRVEVSKGFWPNFRTSEWCVCVPWWSSGPGQLLFLLQLEVLRWMNFGCCRIWPWNFPSFLSEDLRQSSRLKISVERAYIISSFVLLIVLLCWIVHLLLLVLSTSTVCPFFCRVALQFRPLISFSMSKGIVVVVCVNS